MPWEYTRSKCILVNSLVQMRPDQTDRRLLEVAWPLVIGIVQHPILDWKKKKSYYTVAWFPLEMRGVGWE